jgi:hypothetical protein
LPASPLARQCLLPYSGSNYSLPPLHYPSIVSVFHTVLITPLPLLPPFWARPFPVFDTFLTLPLSF